MNRLVIIFSPSILNNILFLLLVICIIPVVQSQDLRNPDSSYRAHSNQSSMTIVTNQESSDGGCEPDLIVEFLGPPMIFSKGGNIVYIHDTTVNVGGSPASPSIIRYFISSQQPVTPSMSNFLGERKVKELEPGEGERSPRKQSFNIPTELPHNRYYFTACVDANNAVTERDEKNNCISGSSNGYREITTAPAKCRKPAKKTNNLASFLFDAFEPGINRLISKGDAYQKIIRRFGKPLRVESNKNTTSTQGIKKINSRPRFTEYILKMYYDGLIIELSSIGHNQWYNLKNIIFTTLEHKLKHGLKIGSSRKEIINILGAPKTEFGYTNTAPLLYIKKYKTTENSNTGNSTEVHSEIKLRINLDRNGLAKKFIWEYSGEFFLSGDTI